MAFPDRDHHLSEADRGPGGGTDDEAIREQVRRTVVHEIAHYYGIDDDRLEELGKY